MSFTSPSINHAINWALIKNRVSGLPYANQSALLIFQTHIIHGFSNNTTMLVFFSTLALLLITVALYVRQPKFGRTPSGERLLNAGKSPHYSGGKFQNLSLTPGLTDGANVGTVLWELLFYRNKRSQPADVVPSLKTDLFKLDPAENALVWFGHSSYFMQVDGKKILVDPVLSGTASPIGASAKSFKGSDVYKHADIPEIDFLFISHDHWDHVDYQTLRRLKPKIKKVICGLGTGAHLEYWGYDPAHIIEKGWNEQVALEEGFTVDICPARHFSGRGFARNKALWVSFALTTPTLKIYIGGDSGYDAHFAAVGAAHGPFDLAILECGQYDRKWKYIHLNPEEVVQAAQDLKAKKLFAVHWGKFALANHDWDDPIIRVAAESARRGMPLLHPLIGEKVNLNETGVFTKWWEGLR